MYCKARQISFSRLGAVTPNILQSARYPNTYALDLGPHDLISEVFTWPDGQSVGIRVVDRDLRNDDTIGSVVLPASARETYLAHRRSS